MLQIPKFKELSFLVYGLGLSGRSVIKFFEKNKIKNFKVWDDKQKKIYNKDVIIETLISFKRSGANAIITYFADKIAKEL